jgi:hypothetical protein
LFYGVEDFDGTQELNEVLGLSKADYRTMKLAYRQGGQKRMMPPFPGARELVTAVKEAGAEVWITTTRPWQRFDSTDPDTRHWLDRHRIPYDHLLFDDDKYGVLSNLVEPIRVVAVLEDLGENYDRAWGNHLPTWLIKTRYNRAVRRCFELGSLGEAQNMIVRKVQEWTPHQK